MDEYEGLTPAEYEADRARARQVLRFENLPAHIQRNMLRLREPGAIRELFRGASNNRESGEFLNRYMADMQQNLRSPESPVRKAANDVMGEYIAQVTPKNMGYGFESDMGGTFGGPDGVYIRGTSADEEGYRERQFDRMKERMGNPFRGV